ncbi:hypothetical protein P168DRAFT_67899 [Aspergillus campestris IBT 28561]|uniref:Lysine-specific metallo-endopeptidase domain-containing protein n=1 Tax=Aspergillus campestris (strain IBT 28561) TaxID=1392248 RepID=A0A2I1CS13_ASPC2|nr:uncharacterized protein P168DRAFT_67899 [Aspergillus campestris IBT 28561]PKY00412.1 hypothetical protein P168DRAFT_67899 [Aspergillus campestris IBT 28561]
MVDNAVKMLDKNDDETFKLRDMLFPKLAFHKLNKPREALQTVSDAMVLNSGRDAGVKDMRDPIIFCDLDRWEKVGSAKRGEPQAYRNKLTQKFDDNADGMLTKCMHKKEVAAYSSRFEGEGSENSQDFIQLCPWWLEWVEGDELQKDLNKWTDAEWANMRLPPQASKPGKETWLDAILTFERNLIHEFSHTSNGGKTDDMKGPDGSMLYGWKQCVNTPVLDKFKNADSLGLFCVATDLVDKKMQRPLKDGNLERMCPGKGKTYENKCAVM